MHLPFVLEEEKVLSINEDSARAETMAAGRKLAAMQELQRYLRKAWRLKGNYSKA